VLPFAWSLDPRQLQRFKNEARAAAQLHHQNIVPVYAVGCERGVHFFAMQYIEGQTLAEAIRRFKMEDRGPGIEDRGSKETIVGQKTQDSTLPVDPRSSILDPRSSILHPRSAFFRTVAQLGVQAADALEHAHEL